MTTKPQTVEPSRGRRVHRRRPVPPSINEQLADIQKATGAERAKLIEDFHRRQATTYDNWARGLVNRFNLWDHRDDVYQEVCAYAVRMVDTWTPKFGDDWHGMMWIRLSREVIRPLVENGTFDGFSGASSFHRRHRKLLEVAADLTQSLGSSPTDEQVVAEHNRRAKRAYADYRRAGMHATVDDLRTLLITSSTDEHEHLTDSLSDQAPTASEFSIIHPSETAAFRQRIYEACDQVDPNLRVLAETIWGVEEDSVTLTRSEVAELLGIPTRKAAEQMRRVRDIAGWVLAVEYGIDADEWMAGSDQFVDKRLAYPHTEGEGVSERTVWRLRDGSIHRDFDQPAVVWKSGTQEWWIKGDRHRDSGPAIVYANGNKRWYTNGTEQPAP